MSYTLAYKGTEIDDILGRAAPGGALDTAIAAKQDALTFDAVPTEGSTNPAESGGIYDAIQAGGAAALAAFATDSVSGDVVSFPDGADGIPVKAFTGSILPQQNLNGQSAPYPAGGGKNLLPMTLASIKSLNTSGTWSGNAYTIAGITYTVGVDGGGNVTGITASGTATGTAAIRVSGGFTLAAGSYKLNGCPSGGDWSTKYGVNVRYESTTHADKGTGYNISASYAISVEYSEILIRSGYAASNLQFKPMIRLATESDAFAPYANICPISGWTGANITRCGKNQYDVHNDIAQAGYIKSDGTIESNNGWRVTRYIPLMPSSTYTASGLAAAANYQHIALYDASQTLTRTIAITANTPITFTTTASEVFVRLSVRVSASEYLTAQLELGATATAYEAYTADTIVLTFGDTVYAGTLTALGGGLWQVQPTHKATTINDINWLYSAQNHFFYAEVTEMATAEDVMCSCYKYIGTKTDAQMSSADDYSIAVGPSSPYLKVKDTRYTTAASLQADMGSETILYPLATLPDPITITGEDLQTLLGANTVWLDCGAVTGMTYRADTALYIDKKLGA